MRLGKTKPRTAVCKTSTPTGKTWSCPQATRASCLQEPWFGCFLVTQLKMLNPKCTSWLLHFKIHLPVWGPRAPRSPLGTLMGCESGARQNLTWQLKLKTLGGPSQRSCALPAQRPASRGERQVTQHHGPEGNSHSKTPWAPGPLSNSKIPATHVGLEAGRGVPSTRRGSDHGQGRGQGCSSRSHWLGGGVWP